MAKSFSELVRKTTTKSTRDKAAKRSQQLLDEILSGEVRDLAGKSQYQLAKTLGVEEPGLAKLDRQQD